MTSPIQEIMIQEIMGPFDAALTAIFKNTPLINYITTHLTTAERYPLIIQETYSKKIRYALIQAIANEINSIKSSALKQFFYCESFSIEEFKKELHSVTRNCSKEVILIFNAFSSEIHACLSYIPKHWQVIFFNDAMQSSLPFTTLRIGKLLENHRDFLLKHYVTQLEKAHSITIPDDITFFAMSLVRQYMHSLHYIDKTLELLDIAARYFKQSAKTADLGEAILNFQCIADVMSIWTSIPTSNLLNSKFKLSHLANGMKQLISGQDHAINKISLILQQSQLKLQESQKPVLTFLFVGEKNTGKKECAEALAHYLFGTEESCYRISLNQPYSSLAEIKPLHTSMNLFECVNKTPYAIFLIEDIDNTWVNNLNLFNEIFSKGYGTHHQHCYDFTQSIFIITTTLASEKITPHSFVDEKVDLMQLVLNESILKSSQTASSSYEELNQLLIPALKMHFSSLFLNSIHVVPFLSLDSNALEKMIRLKLKSLGKKLSNQFKIELQYSQDVVKFLSHEISYQKTFSFESLLNFYLYKGLTQALISLEKTRAKKIMIKLSDQGQLQFSLVSERVEENDSL